MAEFAGYNMPIEFTGINDEHLTVRERAGVFVLCFISIPHWHR